MFFTCPQCSTRYEAEDDLTGQSIDCPNCKNTIVVTPETEPEPEFKLEMSPTPPASAGTQPEPEFKSTLNSESHPEPQPETQPERVPCEFCGEMIMSTAKICRFCNRSTGKEEIIDQTSPNAILLPLKPERAKTKHKWGIACWGTPVAMFVFWAATIMIFQGFPWNSTFFSTFFVIAEFILLVFFVYSIIYYCGDKSERNIKCPCGFTGQPNIRPPSIFWLLFFWPGCFLIGTSYYCPKCGRKAV